MYPVLETGTDINRCNSNYQDSTVFFKNLVSFEKNKIKPNDACKTKTGILNKNYAGLNGI